MRAIQVSSFGGREVLTPVEMPDSVPGPGQVVVDMAVADVILLDTLLRSGWGQDFFPRTVPYVPGGGGAGQVMETGEGVDPELATRRGIRVLAPLLDGPLDQETMRAMLGLAFERAVAGRLRPMIGATYPLERAAGRCRPAAQQRMIKLPRGPVLAARDQGRSCGLGEVARLLASPTAGRRPG